MSLEFEDTTGAIIGAAFEVYNVLGYGFLEKVYQRALQVELLRRGHSAAPPDVNPWLKNIRRVVSNSVSPTFLIVSGQPVRCGYGSVCGWTLG